MLQMRDGGSGAFSFFQRSRAASSARRSAWLKLLTACIVLPWASPAAAIPAGPRFPLPDGATWNYVAETRTVTGSTTFNGVEVKVVQDNVGNQHYYTNDASGILFHGADFVDPTGNETDIYEPPVVLAPADMVVGGSVSGAGTVFLFHSVDGNSTVPYSSTSVVIGVESSVTVPAGTFADVVHVQTTINYEETIGTFSRSVDSWLASGVGVIRETTNDSEGFMQTLELKSYSVPDTTPNAFSFAPKTAQSSGIFVVSDPITVSGINAPSPISVSGGEYQVNGGVFTAAPGTVTNGNQVAVRVVSAQPGLSATVTLNVGGVTGTFTVATSITLTVSPAGPVDFGSVVVGGSIDRSFTVQNTGSGTLTGGASVPAPFMIVSGGAFSLPAGSSQTMVVRFAPNTPGVFSVSLAVTSNGGNKAVSVSGTGVADTTAPDTTITANPPALTNATSAGFSFTATEAGSTFECKLDGAAFAACTSPQNYSALAVGSHTFQVRAIDAAGNTDPTPATFSWTIDTTAPDTTLTATPPAVTSSTSASFSFTATEAGSTFECKLDGGAFGACTSPQNYSALAAGAHTFQVRAVDPAGNTDPTPATFGWTIDTTAPDTTLTATPPAVTNSTSASFSFTATEAGSTFECKRDGAAFGACTSPQNYSALAAGAHTFQVRAIDRAGNIDPTPATFSWTIDTALDTTPPAILLVSPTSSPTYSASDPRLTLSGSASDDVGVTQVTWTNSRGGGGSASGTTNWIADGILLRLGMNVLAVTARDAAGNTATTTLTVTLVIGFTDDPLTETTPIRVVHFVELRSAIDSARAAFGLPTFMWTDPTLVAGVTPVQALHLTELRTALDQAYQVAGRGPRPTYTDPTIVAGETIIKASHLIQLRAALLALLE